MHGKKIIDIFRGSLTKKIKSSIKIYLCLLFVYNFILILFPLYLKFIFEELSVAFNLDSLMWLGTGFLCLVAIQSLSLHFKNYSFIYLNKHLEMRLLRNSIKKLSSKQSRVLQSRGSGELYETVHAVSSVNNGVSKLLPTMAFDVFVAVVVMIVMLFLNPLLGVIAIGLSVLLMSLRAFILFKYSALIYERINEQGKEKTRFNELIEIITSAKIFFFVDALIKKWEENQRNIVNINIKLEKFNATLEQLGIYLWSTLNGVILVFGAILVSENSITIGALIAFVIYKDIFLEKVQNLFQLLGEYMEVSASMRKLEFLKDLPEDATADDSHSDLISKSSKPTLEVKNLSFSYHDEGSTNSVLNKLSFSFL